MKRLLQTLILIIGVAASAQILEMPDIYLSSPDTRAADPGWPEAADEARPYARWWWMGSAMDTAQLDLLLDEYSRAGLGGLEITPIYGIQGLDSMEIQYLSPEWMHVYKHVADRAHALGMSIDMNNGTGWPFGGPNIDTLTCAKRITVDSDGTPVVVPTRQRVKRAAPGGEGLVLDHFDKDAVTHYLERFTEAFDSAGVPYPHNLFNDSYEVYKADWTPTLAQEFERRKGYDIMATGIVERRFAQKDDAPLTDDERRIISDYREVLGQLLFENFTNVWTDWAHAHGSITRSQAHGSPGNLIDIYAAVDIPECEGFGMSDFGIRGLRTDSLTRPNFSDLSMLKYASSAAHISGKPLVSAEAMTWLTEHFRTSLSQCKPELDLFFTAGVNHICFHGTAYSPTDDPWPGWKFYASIDLSPTNTIWRDAPAMMQYITRCQSFLQMGRPDADLLVYLPVHDMWHDNDGTLLMFDINKMASRAPRFIAAIDSVISLGYDCDYLSDAFVKGLKVGADGQLITAAGTVYQALMVPQTRLMPEATAEALLHLAQQGARIVMAGGLPQDVPGYNDVARRRLRLDSINHQLRAVALSDIDQCHLKAEEMRSRYGLHAIRRANDTGHHYFISALQPQDVEGWVTLGRDAEAALWFDPMDGSIRQAQLRGGDEGTQVYMALESGQSMILQTFTHASSCPGGHRPDEPIQSIERQKLTGVCTLDLGGDIITLQQAQPWTSLGIAALDSLAGGLAYTFVFDVDTDMLEGAQRVLLDLGDVRESARVTLNGEYAGTLWAVPFKTDITGRLRPQGNVLRVEVTNLPANRISALDRKGVKWRKFKEINIVDRNYKTTTYAHWPTVESGLMHQPSLIFIK